VPKTPLWECLWTLEKIWHRTCFHGTSYQKLSVCCFISTGGWGGNLAQGPGNLPSVPAQPLHDPAAGQSSKCVSVSPSVNLYNEVNVIC
jgi:hypothetical protein